MWEFQNFKTFFFFFLSFSGSSYYFNFNYVSQLNATKCYSNKKKKLEFLKRQHYFAKNIHLLQCKAMLYIYVDDLSSSI